MKKEYNQTLASPMGRTLVYLSVFIAGSALHELIFRLINPVVWSNSSIALGLSTLGAFILIGGVFACQRHALSRVSSAATLLILGVIAVKMGHTTVPEPYLLLIVLCVAFLGARPLLHRKLVSLNKTILYSLIIIGLALISVGIFTYTVTVIDRIVIR